MQYDTLSSTETVGVTPDFKQRIFAGLPRVQHKLESHRAEGPAILFRQ